MKGRDDLHIGGPGPAPNSGSGCIHLSFRSGSRAGGACGAAAFDYVTREGVYDDEARDPAIYTESGHMPSWAEDDPRAYWDAADLYERANGRLYVSADFALPREMSVETQIELARAFARELTEREHLPYTLAIHEGRGDDGQPHNPHAHLMFSERQNDGIERGRHEWFRRANPEEAERGGAPKSRTFHGASWVEQARERWAALTNQALEAAGRSERVDHRSYERQGIDRQAGEHYGPAAAHLVAQGREHNRIEIAGDVADAERSITTIDKEIAWLESARETILRDGVPEDREPEPRDYSHTQRGDARDDQSWER